MKIKKQAVTLVEAVVVILIISIGLTGVYLLYNNSMRFLDGIESKIQATQIAREGIEAVENIRDTNWINFSSDKENCWNTLDYSGACVGGGIVEKIGSNSGKNYKIYINDDRWYLYEDKELLGENYKEKEYQRFYRVFLNEKGLYNQMVGVMITDGKVDRDASIKNKIFTRRINIKNIDVKGLDTSGRLTDYSSGILVRSIVEWRDMESSKPRKVELENILTNWSKNK